MENWVDICHLQKKRERKDEYKNYRGVTVMSIFSQTLNLMEAFVNQ